MKTAVYVKLVNRLPDRISYFEHFPIRATKKIIFFTGPRTFLPDMSVGPEVFHFHWTAN